MKNNQDVRLSDTQEGIKVRYSSSISSVNKR